MAIRVFKSVRTTFTFINEQIKIVVGAPLKVKNQVAYGVKLFSLAANSILVAIGLPDATELWAEKNYKLLSLSIIGLTADSVGILSCTIIPGLNVTSLVTVPISLSTKAYIRRMKYKKIIADGDCKQLFMELKTDITEIQKTAIETNEILKNIFAQLQIRGGSKSGRFIINIACFRKILPILEIASSIPQKGQYITPETTVIPKFEQSIPTRNNKVVMSKFDRKGEELILVPEIKKPEKNDKTILQIRGQERIRMARDLKKNRTCNLRKLNAKQKYPNMMYTVETHYGCLIDIGIF